MIILSKIILLRYNLYQQSVPILCVKRDEFHKCNDYVTLLKSSYRTFPQQHQVASCPRAVNSTLRPSQV